MDGAVAGGEGWRGEERGDPKGNRTRGKKHSKGEVITARIQYQCTNVCINTRSLTPTLQVSPSLPCVDRLPLDPAAASWPSIRQCQVTGK